MFNILKLLQHRVQHKYVEALYTKTLYTKASCFKLEDAIKRWFHLNATISTSSYPSLAKCHEKGHKMPHPMFKPTVT